MMNRASDLEKERRRAIFVMQNFVPEEQRGRVDLEFVMLQLRRSPVSPHLDIPAYLKLNEDQQSTSAGVNESLNEDWEDLMQWSNQSLLDTIESREVHLFQWERTYKFLAELVSGLRGMVAPTPRFEMQRKEISIFLQLLREKRSKGRVKADDMTRNNPKKAMNVCWIIWKLRGVLATIPTPVTKAASVTANFRLFKFHEELGIIPIQKLNHWIVKNPEHYLLYLVTVCWFPQPPPAQH